MNAVIIKAKYLLSDNECPLTLNPFISFQLVTEIKLQANWSVWKENHKLALKIRTICNNILITAKLLDGLKLRWNDTKINPHYTKFGYRQQER